MGGMGALARWALGCALLGTLPPPGAGRVAWPSGLDTPEPVLLATSLQDCPGRAPSRQPVAGPGPAPGARASPPPWELHAAEGASHLEGGQLAAFRAGGCVLVAGEVAVAPAARGVPSAEVQVSLEGHLGDYRERCTPGAGAGPGGSRDGPPALVQHLWSGRGCAGGCLVGAASRFPLPEVPGVFSLCVRWRMTRASHGPAGEGRVGSTPRSGDEVWTHHLIATSWRGSLPGWVPFAQVTVWAAQAAAAAWPLPAAAEEAEEAVGRAMLSGVMRLGKRGEVAYGVWERPPGMRDAHKTWHLLRSRRGLCGELTALLEEMLAAQGVPSAGVKLCFADALAAPTPTPPRDAIWYLSTRRAAGGGPPPEGRRAALGMDARVVVDYRDHSALAVGSGWVLDPTYGVASPSWEDYLAHVKPIHPKPSTEILETLYLAQMAAVQWEFCACRGGNWTDDGCVAGPGPEPPPGSHPTAGPGRAPPGSRPVAAACTPLPPPREGGGGLAAALPGGEVPLQVVRYDPRGIEGQRVVAGYATDVLCA